MPLPAPRMTHLADRLEALEREAGEAGDIAQVDLCRLALAGDSHALRLCLRALADAEAMRDDEEATA
jgi:hypothetical protein